MSSVRMFVWWPADRKAHCIELFLLKEDPFMSEDVMQIQEDNDLSEYFVLFDVSCSLYVFLIFPPNLPSTAAICGNNLSG